MLTTDILGSIMLFNDCKAFLSLLSKRSKTWSPIFGSECIKGINRCPFKTSQSSISATDDSELIFSRFSWGTIEIDISPFQY